MRSPTRLLFVGCVGSLLVAVLCGDVVAKTAQNDLAIESTPTPIGEPAKAVTLYVRGDGGTITLGADDDSASDVSSMVERTGRAQLTVPAWSGGPAGWKQVMSCVKDRLSPFAVTVTDSRPKRGDYIMAMVGGRSSMLKFGDDISGITASDGSVERNAVVYVFSDTDDNDTEDTCVAVIHEFGHAVGLDHEYLCKDPMTYLSDCGEKSFQDVTAPCGEDSARTCDNGNATQNSFQYLASAIGLREPSQRTLDAPTALATAEQPVELSAEKSSEQAVAQSSEQAVDEDDDSVDDAPPATAPPPPPAAAPPTRHRHHSHRHRGGQWRSRDARRAESVPRIHRPAIAHPTH